MKTTPTATDVSGPAPPTDDPNKEIKAKLADFLLSLIQAS